VEFFGALRPGTLWPRRASWSPRCALDSITLEAGVKRGAEGNCQQEATDTGSRPRAFRIGIILKITKRRFENETEHEIFDGFGGDLSCRRIHRLRRVVVEAAAVAASQGAPGRFPSPSRTPPRTIIRLSTDHRARGRAQSGEEIGTESWETVATPGKTYNLLELVNGALETWA